MVVLANRHIPVTGQCLICLMGPEDIKHLMFSCVHARQVWLSLGILDVVEDDSKLDKSGSVVLEEIMRRPSNKSLVLGHVGLKEIIITRAWYMWWQRPEGFCERCRRHVLRSGFKLWLVTLVQRVQKQSHMKLFTNSKLTNKQTTGKKSPEPQPDTTQHMSSKEAGLICLR